MTIGRGFKGPYKPLYAGLEKHIPQNIILKRPFRLGPFKVMPGLAPLIFTLGSRYVRKCKRNVKAQKYEGFESFLKKNADTYLLR